MSLDTIIALIEKYEAQLKKCDYEVNGSKVGPNYTEQILKHLYSKLDKA